MNLGSNLGLELEPLSNNLGHLHLGLSCVQPGLACWQREVSAGWTEFSRRLDLCKRILSTSRFLVYGTAGRHLRLCDVVEKTAVAEAGWFLSRPSILGCFTQR